jgi:hypothetical protein
MAWSHAVTASSAVAGLGGNTGFAGRLVERLRRLLVPHWPLLRLSGASSETVVSRHGIVEIRETRAGFSVQTRVKGELDRARATALQRIAKYIAGGNHGGTQLRAAAPLVQREEAPGRWLVSAALPGVEAAFVAAVSRNGKARIYPAQPELLAVLRIAGRPATQAIARGDAAIRAALVGTVWTPAGEPVIRLHRPPEILPFASRFEVAIPVARRRQDAPP